MTDTLANIGAHRQTSTRLVIKLVPNTHSSKHNQTQINVRYTKYMVTWPYITSRNTKLIQPRMLIAQLRLSSGYATD
jgi:hypothetical protein